jgi:acetyltransferase-like isoleucine patch superfamily enzyme
MKNYHIYNDVFLGENVSIHPYAVIGKPPQIPSGTTVYKPSLTKTPTVIGDNCVIGANAVIYQGCTVGKNTLIGDGAKLRDNVIIGQHCIIGMSTKVGPNTIIYNKVKIMDLCNIAGNMIIEDGVFVAQGTMCANDKWMGRPTSGTIFKGPVIRKYATIGANATILPGIEIGENAIIGAGALIVEDVSPRVVMVSPKAVYLRDVTSNELKGE